MTTKTAPHPTPAPIIQQQRRARTTPDSQEDIWTRRCRRRLSRKANTTVRQSTPGVSTSPRGQDEYVSDFLYQKELDRIRHAIYLEATSKKSGSSHVKGWAYKTGLTATRDGKHSTSTTQCSVPPPPPPPPTPVDPCSLVVVHGAAGVAVNAASDIDLVEMQCMLLRRESEYMSMARHSVSCWSDIAHEPGVHCTPLNRCANHESKRTVVLDWMHLVGCELYCTRQSVQQAVDLFDRYVARKAFGIKQIQSVALACLMSAYSYDVGDFHPIPMDVWQQTSSNAFSGSLLTRMQLNMMETLAWRLSPATSYEFLSLYVTRAHVQKEYEVHSCTWGLDVIALCSSSIFYSFPPSMWAACSLLFGCTTYDWGPVGTHMKTLLADFMIVTPTDGKQLLGHVWEKTVALSSHLLCTVYTEKEQDRIQAALKTFKQTTTGTKYAIEHVTGYSLLDLVPCAIIFRYLFKYSPVWNARKTAEYGISAPEDESDKIRVQIRQSHDVKTLSWVNFIRPFVQAEFARYRFYQSCCATPAATPLPTNAANPANTANTTIETNASTTCSTAISVH